MTAASALEAGDQAPEFIIEDVNRTMLARYAGASGDMNPMHTDDTAAQAVGYPGVFAHGMFSAGIAAQWLSRWLGHENLRTFKVRFKKQVWPGDTLSFNAEVVEVERSGRNGTTVIAVDLLVTNQDGTTVLEGSATADAGADT